MEDPSSESQEIRITVSDLKATEGLLSEATHVLDRARKLAESHDFNGSIEAAQHCMELAIKSLYRLVNLPVPRSHFERKNQREEEHPLEKVAECFEGIEEYLMTWLGKTSWIGRMWAWAHNTSMYGCLNIPARKLFDPKDAEVAIYYGDEVLKNCKLIYYSVRDGRTKIKPPQLQKT